MLETLPAQVALAESPDLSPSTPASELPLGIPAAYWLDLRAYDQLATARNLQIPIFLSQGGRDYQVPPSELAAWRTALAGRADVAIHEYPALNHLLMAGTGPSRPAEYAVPGHVAPELVADLAAWIRDGGIGTRGRPSPRVSGRAAPAAGARRWSSSTAPPRPVVPPHERPPDPPGRGPGAP